MANTPTTFRNSTAIAARTPEVPAASWTTGCNNGLNSCGIGIATDVDDLDESLPSWTLLDQFGDARTPQISQLIGGNGLGAGSEGRGDGDAEFIIGVINGANGAITANGTANLVTLAAGWSLV
jgi:hypothetical protein